MRSAVIEIGPTTTRAVVADPTPGDGITIRLDRRIVLRLGQAIERTGAIGEGLRLLVVETVQRLQTECLRAGVGRAQVVIAADLAAASDLTDLVRTIQRRCGVPPDLRSLDGEARLLLAQVAVTGDLAVADVDDRLVRIVDRRGGHVTVRRRSGPRALGHDGGRRSVGLGGLRGIEAAAGAVVPGVEPLRAATAVATGPVATTVLRALWARNGRGQRPPTRYEVRRDACAALERELLALSPTQRLLLPAVAPDEVDTVVLGAGYLRALADRWEATTLVVVSTSILEEQLRREVSTRPTRSDGASRTGVAR